MSYDLRLAFRAPAECPYCGSDIGGDVLAIYDPEIGIVVDFECPRCEESLMLYGLKTISKQENRVER